MNKAIFLDKDGTLIEDAPYNVNPELIRLTDGAAAALKTLAGQGFRLIVVTNQSGVARGYFPEQALAAVWRRIEELLAPDGIQIEAFLYCPHHPDGTVEAYARACQCRKPQAGMLLKAAREYNIDLQRSWMIGDILNDVEAGNAAGCRTILVDNGNETEWILSGLRKPTAIVRTLTEAAGVIAHKMEMV